MAGVGQKYGLTKKKVSPTDPIVQGVNMTQSIIQM